MVFLFAVVMGLNYSLCRSQISTRNVVERSYGVLKRRFPILHSGMQLSRVEAIQKVISVCCVLHNLCIDLGDTFEEEGDEDYVPDDCEGDDELPPPPQPQPPGRLGRLFQGRLARDEIVEIFARRFNIDGIA